MGQYYIRRGSKTRGPFVKRKIRYFLMEDKLQDSDEIAKSAEGPWFWVEDVRHVILQSDNGRSEAVEELDYVEELPEIPTYEEFVAEHGLAIEAQLEEERAAYTSERKRAEDLDWYSSRVVLATVFTVLAPFILAMIGSRVSGRTGAYTGLIAGGAWGLFLVAKYLKGMLKNSNVGDLRNGVKALGFFGVLGYFMTVWVLGNKGHIESKTAIELIFLYPTFGLLGLGLIWLVWSVHHGTPDE